MYHLCYIAHWQINQPTQPNIAFFQYTTNTSTANVVVCKDRKNGFVGSQHTLSFMYLLP